MNIQQNFLKIQEELKSKNLSSHIIVVTKTFDYSFIKPVLELGHKIYGENKVQEAKKKWDLIKQEYPNIELHLIGSLQTNKAKDAVKIFNFIHSVDSKKLVDALKQAEEKIKINRKYFIQVNTGKESQKSGVMNDDLISLFDYAKEKINIIGLMCIPPVNEEPDKHFKILRDKAKKINLPELSMGMSADYLIAASLGATYIRVGSKIFGNRA